VFGGVLRLDQVGDLLVCRFESPAPILRRGGHSQLFDLGAANAGEFFARLMIKIDFLPGFESLLSAATPVARYAAFVADFLGRCEASASIRQTHGPVIREFQLERRRIQVSEAAECAAGIDLLAAASVPERCVTPRPGARWAHANRRVAAAIRLETRQGSGRWAPARLIPRSTRPSTSGGPT
jgi:hypothetical protein